MSDKKIEIRLFQLLLVILVFVFFARSSAAQSTDQNYPTAITANEINGRIPARDVGDARQTSYFYVFNAVQGDVFINVVTANFNGDIDVFTADNLRPLTKITVYADAADSETGRVIYLRQPAKLILRVEGRTPNDDPASYRIKFAGSFAPAAINTAENSATPTVKSDNQTDIRVNSVGTIIEVKPKPTPAPKEIIAEKNASREAENKETRAKKTADKNPSDAKIAENQTEINEAEEKSGKEKPTSAQTETKPAIVDAEEVPKKESRETEVIAADEKKNSTVATDEKNDDSKENKDAVVNETIAKIEPKKIEKSKPVKPQPIPLAALENIRLIVLFKDGSKLERSMSEITKVGVDKGILTILSKDGTIGRYSILDVEKMTIE